MALDTIVLSTPSFPSKRGYAGAWAADMRQGNFAAPAGKHFPKPGNRRHCLPAFPAAPTRPPLRSNSFALGDRRLLVRVSLKLRLWSTIV